MSRRITQAHDKSEAQPLRSNSNRSLFSSQRLAHGILALGVAGALLVPVWGDVGHAAPEHVLRLGTLAPKGSSFDKVFKAFNRSLKAKSGGRVRIQMYSGGVAGDERDVIRKMKVGQMDGASLTSVGLGQIVRSVMVLQLPGLFEDPGQLERVRTAMTDDFTKMFDKSGYVFMGWGDVGDRRVFSNKPILSPKDFKSTRPWVWREDPITPAVFKTIGANGVPLGLPEVLPALQTGMLDTVTATAVSAVALQWFRHVTHMSKSTGEPVVGATVLRKEAFAKLNPELQEMVTELSAKAHTTLLKRVRVEDAAAARTLVKRGMKEFDMMSRRDEWEPVLKSVAKKLTGQVYSRELLERVWTIARGEGVPMD